MFDDITNISKIAINEGDVLIITVDTKDMPSHIAQKYMDDILTAAKVYFLTTQIMVVPKGVQFSVMTPHKGNKNES
jgi:hypothetical protein